MNGFKHPRQSSLEVAGLQRDVEKKIHAAQEAYSEFIRFYDAGFERKGGFPSKDPLFMTDFFALGARVESFFREAERAYNMLRLRNGLTYNISDSFRQAEKAFRDAQNKEGKMGKKEEEKPGYFFAKPFARENRVLELYRGLSAKDRTLITARTFFNAGTAQKFTSPLGADYTALETLSPELCRLVSEVEKKIASGEITRVELGTETIAAMNAFKRTRFYQDYASEQEHLAFANSTFAGVVESVAQFLRKPVVFAAPFSAKAGEEFAASPSEETEKKFLQAAALDFGCAVLLGKLGQTVVGRATAFTAEAAEKVAEQGVLRAVPRLLAQAGAKLALEAGSFFLLYKWDDTFKKSIDILFSDSEEYSSTDRITAARNLVNYYVFMEGIFAVVPAQARAAFRSAFQKASAKLWEKGIEKLAGSKALKKLGEAGAKELGALARDLASTSGKRTKKAVEAATRRIRAFGEKYGLADLARITEEKVAHALMRRTERFAAFWLAPAVPLTYIAYTQAALTDPKLLAKAWEEYGGIGDDIRKSMTIAEYRKLKALDPDLTPTDVKAAFKEYGELIDEDAAYAKRRFAEYIVWKIDNAKHDEFMAIMKSDQMVDNYWFSADSRSGKFNEQYAWIRQRFKTREEWKQHYIKTLLPPDAEKAALDKWLGRDEEARSFSSPTEYLSAISYAHLQTARVAFEVERNPALDPNAIAALLQGTTEEE